MLKPTILIVDDDKGISFLLKNYLEGHGFSVECACDGQEMDQKLDQYPFDVILLDWMMPGEDGLAICQRLSQAKQRPAIIMMTANGSENQQLQVLNAGADDFLLKPFNTGVLLQRINALLNSRAGLPEAISFID